MSGIKVGLTDGQSVTEVVHAVSHDDHPGDAGDAGVLHVLVRVAVPSVRVTVAVSVRFGPVAVLLRGRGLAQGLVQGGLWSLELCDLSVAVAVVTDCNAVRV